MVRYCWMLQILAAILRVKVAEADGGDTYNAVVVEYSPSMDPSVDAVTNLLNNVHNFVDIVNEANKLVQVDIIVFPEEGLKGYSNQELFLEVPDPEDNLVLCAKESRFENALVQLSCAARGTATYIVVNLSEKTYEESVQKMMYHNTDVVFNRDGAIIARYRKIHLFGEGSRQPPLDKKLVYFDTDFGVRFGIFTCFDIIFKYPGIVSRRDYNITHFIFPTAWFSEMPFLTAIQEQWYWSYTQDSVLLVAGYNLPAVGSSGTGIYLGHRGPAAYSMAETRGAWLLHVAVPKDIHYHNHDTEQGHTNLITSTKLKTTSTNYVNNENDQTKSPKLKLKRDFLDVYATKLIYFTDDTKEVLNGTDLIVKFDVHENLCHGELCCKFNLTVTLVYSLATKAISRGDDYSQLNYRMAAFDGVRTYDYFATGGLQTCALVPCVRGDLSSCGLRSDDPSAKPNTLLGYHQTAFIFDYIHIEAEFSNNDSSIGPNVLLGGKGDSFGSLLAPDGFDFRTSNETKSSVVKSLEVTNPIDNLVTMSIYGRLFDRDGLAYTGSPNTSSTWRCGLWELSLLTICILINNI